jgi:hypothetical protein
MSHIYKLFTLFFLCSNSALSAQGIIYVQPTASGLNNGTSWQNAYTSLRIALQQAQNNDQVWVANGTYYPTNSTDRSVYFEVPPGVVLLGGFTGTETHPNQRNLSTLATIISGDIGVINDSTDNSHNLLYLRNPSAGTTIDGFWIRDGQADKDTTTSLYNNGPAILIDFPNEQYNQITIRNCRFSHHTAKNSGAVSILAPIDHNSNNTIAIRIEDCLFEHNRSWIEGGGLGITGKNHPGQTITVKNCDFTDNRAAEYSGGAYFYCSNLQLDSCRFERNTSRLQGGGIRIVPAGHDSADIHITHCYFTKNASYLGSGMYAPGSEALRSFNLNHSTFIENIGVAIAPTNPPLSSAFSITTTWGDTADVTCTHNIIKNNKYAKAFEVVGADYGKTIFSHNYVEGDSTSASGISALYDSLLITNNFFNENRFGTTIRSIYNTKVTVVANNIFRKNNNLRQGTFAFGVITNNLFLNNSMSSVNCIGCVNGIDTPLIVSNNIFWNNTNLANSGPITWNIPFANANIIFDHNLFDFLPTDSLPNLWTLGEGNQFKKDPMLLDTGSVNIRLDLCSPAINAGIPNWINAYGITTDINGNQRIRGAQIDIGPFEAPALSWAQPPVSNASCSSSATGSIVLQTTDACLPYTITWSDGINTGTQLDNLPAGTYTITITDQKGDQIIDTITIEAVVLPGPDAFTIVKTSCDTCANGQIVFSGNHSDWSFSWSNGASTGTITQLLAGEYTCTITQTDGCTVMYSFMVEATSSTDDVIVSKLSLWPNPGTDNLHIEVPQEAQGWLVVLMDMSGKTLMQQAITSTKELVSTSQLLPGTYRVMVLDSQYRLRHHELWVKLVP